MGKELLLEIGTEEIPSSFLHQAQNKMKELFALMLDRERIICQRMETYGTPRRLVLFAQNVSERQQDRVSKVMGPPVRVAYDERGTPTKAALAFAQKNRVRMEDLTIQSTEKGDYLSLITQEVGQESRRILQDLLPNLIKQIPFPKTMRWSDKDLRFVRPIHWILALFNGDTIPFELEGIKSTNFSRGHRFMAPKDFQVKNFADYLEKIEEHKVIVDQGQRKKIIREHLDREAGKVNGRPLEDEELLDIVTNLVEYPFPICGSFEPLFLELPKEVLVMVMKEHQRYFPVVDTSGRLLPKFIAISNTRPRNPDIVRAGNERVLRARFADAKFFFDEDRKRTLNSFVENLKNVIFIKSLGTSYEKVLRIGKIASFLIECLDPGKKATVARAAFLCKADLVSQMVYEFPKLQGVMGREYALHGGESIKVSQAISEHYLPRYSGDDLPESLEGAVLAIADRMDTLLGCFGVGLIPSGSEDPYGLRRQALGIIQIIMEKSLRISLKRILSQANDELREKVHKKPTEVIKEVMFFFQGRLQNLLLNQGYSYDLVEAVLSWELDDLVLLKEKLTALTKFKEREDFKALMVGFKRAINILSGKSYEMVEPSLFIEEAEKNLYQSYLEVKDNVRTLMEREEFFEALMEMAKLKPAIDRLFNEVMVMAEDEKMRQNRLALLSVIVNLFNPLGDFSKIKIEA